MHLYFNIHIRSSSIILIIIYFRALGADQTHYVQHSRMENAGTGKDEQVVEGSYSYVGDNGKTYTVHYIADGNGFRASGDHLPVAPPVPEIIQRFVRFYVF